MARNEEKAKSMLNLFLRRHELQRQDEKRPVLTSLVSTTQECEKWRRQVLRDIAKEIGEIQNAGLGEHIIREKNDYINKLLREKGWWERRIIELGGMEYAESIGIDTREERQRLQQLEWKRKQQDETSSGGVNRKKTHSHGTHHGNDRSDTRQRSRDYHDNSERSVTRNSAKMGVSDYDGRSALGVDGYFYFGAAKELPGVRELYDVSQQREVNKLKRGDLLKRIDASYYGYLEDTDVGLIEQERAAELQILRTLREEESQIIDDAFATPTAMNGAPIEDGA